ncbi:MAG: glycerol kinase GlpK [Candidatus Mcinerneyibacterium aminivorans]|uniref:glycerol kinase n=1 Tax=Candidatus Mcinerneyibacterium aminivorans TaxID=2703815 RepID=A0A5D0MHT5_9BACT|nr:MAG: glycerol kinase GlpK [Candidatus Mcinerneyibacterium aminivorans]
MKYILAMDQGTSSSRSILYSEKGELIDKCSIEYNVYTPHPGWVEQDPDDILKSQFKTADKIIKRNNLSSKDIISVGITNQRETTIVWDKNTGKPLYNAIVWQCRRSSEICERFKKYREKIHRKTGLYLDPYFSSTKLIWLFENIEGLRKKAEKNELLFGTVDSWLIYNLTGNHYTDITNASRTMLYNIKKLKWDKELLDLFDIPENILPEVKSSNSFFGNVKKEILNINSPIMGVLGDQQASFFGQLCFRKGDLKNTYGTGCFMLMNTDKIKYSNNGLLTTVGYSVDNTVDYCLEGSVFTGGSLIKWLRDNLGIIKNPAQTEKIAKKIDENSGVYIVPAFSGLGAPYWDMNARGLITGLTSKIKKEHIVRAALEAIAYQVKDIYHVFEKDGGEISKMKVDGGASENNFLMQFQSDILNQKIIRPVITETTSLGAAFMSAVGSDIIDLENLEKLYKIDRVFSNKMNVKKINQLYKNWKNAVNKAITKENK